MLNLKSKLRFTLKALFLLALLLFFAYPLCVQSAERKVRVAARICPPFVINDAGQFSGISIFLWDNIAEELGLEYSIEEYGLTEMLEAVTLIRATLENHQGMDPERAPRVFFDEFNADSFNIRMSYWYHLNEYCDFVAFNEKVNFEIFRVFEDHGIQFSLPFRVTYWATDSQQRPLEVEMVERKES